MQNSQHCAVVRGLQPNAAFASPAAALGLPLAPPVPPEQEPSACLQPLQFSLRELPPRSLIPAWCQDTLLGLAQPLPRVSSSSRAALRVPRN